MASGPHTFVTMVVFSATRFEGSRHVVISPRGPPDQTILLIPRKARHANEFNASSTTYIYDAITPISSTPHTPALPLRRLEIYRPTGPGKGLQGYGVAEVAFEPGAILAATHYLCTYIDRSPYWSTLPRGAVEQEGTQQRVSFYLPRLQEQQKAIGVPTADGRVNAMFNTYRQVAAVAVPSISALFKVHEKGMPLKAILNTQPQLKITPEYVRLQLDAECPVVSLGRDMHFVLVDVSEAPAMLPSLVASPAAGKGLTHVMEEASVIDNAPGWGAQSLKKGLVSLVWFIRGNQDTVQGEATIDNARCRVFGDAGAWEEEGLGSAAAALGGFLALENGTDTVVKSMENLDVSDHKADGAEITPTQSQTQSPSQATSEKTSSPTPASNPSTTIPPITNPDQSDTTTSTAKPQPTVHRKVYGISMAQELGRNSTIAVEVDVVTEKDGLGKTKRRLGGMVVSGRANFETRGEILAA